MTRPLILGLGNTLMGDDGVGVRVAELLLADSSVAARADVMVAGTDLLRLMDLFAGRKQVILVDAASGGGEPGKISVADRLLPPAHPKSAHTLSAPETVELLQTLVPRLRTASFTWVLIEVASAAAGQEISAKAGAAIPKAAAVIKELLGCSSRLRPLPHLAGTSNS